MLDVTVVNVAIPDIRSSLGTGPPALQWIVDGYSTVFAALLLLCGGLADRLGYRRVFLAGLGLFTAASLACGLATTSGLLIAGRLAQGAGAALLVPASLALLQASFPDRAVRARAIAVWGGVASVAFGAGPAVGGLLVSGSDWRSVFWLNLPFGALAVLLTLRHIPSSAPRPSTRKADPMGQILAVIGLVGVAGGLNEAGSHGWTSPLVLSVFSVGAAALVTFVLMEHTLESRSTRGCTRRDPLLRPSMFRSRAFTFTTVIGLLISLGYYGMLSLATLYFQQERHLSALDTGLAPLPSVCMGFAAAPLFSRIAARSGPYVPMAAGLVLGAFGFLGWLLAGPGTRLSRPALRADRHRPRPDHDGPCRHRRRRRSRSDFGRGYRHCRPQRVAAGRQRRGGGPLRHVRRHGGRLRLRPESVGGHRGRRHVRPRCPARPARSGA